MTRQPTLKVKEISTITNLSVHSIYRIINEKKLPVINQGNKKLLPPNTVREIFESRAFTYKKNVKPKVINIFGMKGGIGKTSLATAIAEGSSRLGFRVLAIDIDMQGNLTQAFDKKDPSNKVLYDIISEEASIDETLIKVNSHLSIIPSSLVNSGLELYMSTKEIDTPHYFDSIFNRVYSQFDLIVIDCPPSVNKITTCATCFATTNIIPVNADTDSFDGVSMSVGEIKRLEKAFHRSGLKINYRIVFNKYDAREKLSLGIMGQIAQDDELAKNLLQIVVRTDTAFKNTKAECSSIFDVNRSAGKEDCLALISELTGIYDWVENSGGENKQSKGASEEVMVG